MREPGHMIGPIIGNGWVDPYPHDDFERPCTQPCCEPEAYGPGPHWRCDENDCWNELWSPGICQSCVAARKRQEKREPAKPGVLLWTGEADQCPPSR